MIAPASGAGDDVDQGGLAGAVRSDETDDLARREIEADVVQRDEAAEALGHAGHAHEG
jgi:hypothetical protein